MILQPSFNLTEFIQTIKKSHETHVSWFKKSPAARQEVLESLMNALKDTELLSNYFVHTSGMKHKNWINHRVTQWLELTQSLPSELPRAALLCGSIVDEDSQLEQFFLSVVVPLINGQALVAALPAGSFLLSQLKSIIDQLPKNIPCHIYEYTKDQAEAVEWILNHPSIKSVYISTMVPQFLEWANRAKLNKYVSILGEARNVSMVLDVPPADSFFYESILSAESERFRNSRVFVVDSVFDEVVNQIEQQFEKIDYKAGTRNEVSLAQKNQYISENSGRLISYDSHELTLLTDFSNCSPLHQLPNQAHVVTFTRSKYAHEAVKFANTTSLGWTASVWGPVDRAQKMASTLDYDWVYVNQPASYQKTLRFGFGKMSHSGLGGVSIFKIHCPQAQVIL